MKQILLMIGVAAVVGCRKKEPVQPTTPNPETTKPEPTKPEPTKAKATAGSKLWEFETGSSVYSSPAIGSDGTVYVGSTDKKLYAINGKSGVKLWEFETGSDVYSSPAIGPDGTVYVGSGYPFKLYAINGKSGVKLWEFLFEGYIGVSGITLGSDETIYLTRGNKIEAIDGNTRERKWTFDKGGRLSIGTDGAIYFHDGDFYSLDGKTGDVKWKLKERGADARPPAIGADGTVYVSFFHGELYAIDGNTGAKKWKFEYGTYPGGCAIGVDDTVYIPYGNERKLYALDGKTGAKKWEFIWRKDGFDSYVSVPAIGDDGTVYFGTQNNKLYAVDGKTGTKKWEFETGGSVSSPVIGDDGTLYIGSGDKKVYAIKTDSKGPAKSAWPMFGQNAQHTGRVMKK